MTITTPRLALAASLAALTLGAVACGAQTSATDAPTAPKPAVWHHPYVAPGYHEHPPGSFHADTYCRSHPGHGLIRCGPSAVHQRRVGRPA